MCQLRGDDIGMVFQEPMTALNPVKTIGEQVAEGIRLHTGVGRAEAEAARGEDARSRRPAARKSFRCRVIRISFPAASASAWSSRSPAR